MTAKRSSSAKPAKRRAARASKSAARRRAIVVLGMHRSGTSALTRMISLLGATLPKRLMPASDANPRGYFESQAIFELHEALLRSAGTSWFDLASFPTDWLDSPVADDWVGRFADAVASEFEDSALFVLKDPRISRLLPIWSRVFERLEVEPSYVIAVRNPLEVAASLNRAEGTDESKALLLWLQYFLEAERRTRGATRCFVRYDDLLSDWRAVAESIASSADIVFPRRGRMADAEIDDFLTRDLRRNRALDDELFDRHDVTGWVKQAYAWARDAATGSEGDRRALDRVAKAFEVSESVYGPILGSAELARARAQHRTKALEAEVVDLREGVATRQREIDELAKTLKDRTSQLALQNDEMLASRDWSSIRDGDVERLIELVKLILGSAVGRLDGNVLSKFSAQDAGNEDGNVIGALIDAAVEMTRGAGEVGLLRADVAELASQVADVAQTTVALQPALDVGAELSRLNAELAGLEGEVARRDARIDALREAGEEASRVQGALRAEAEELRRALDARRTEVVGLSDDLRRSGVELESLRGKLAADEQARQAVYADFEKVQHESNARERENARLVAELDALKRTISERDAQLEDQKTTHADALRAFDSERLATQQEMAAARSQVGRLEAALVDFENREEQNEENARLLSEARNELLELRVRVASHDDRVSAARAEARSLARDLERAHLDIEELEIRARTYHGQSEELAVAERRVETLTSRVEALEAEERRLSEQHVHELADLNYCVEQLRAELDSRPQPRRRGLFNLMSDEE